MNTRETGGQSALRQMAWSVVAALCMTPLRMLAQDQTPAAAAAAPEAAQQSGTVIKKESRLVLVDAGVTDKKGNYLRDPTQNDFKIYEDNKEHQVSTVSTDADIAGQANAQHRYPNL